LFFLLKLYMLAFRDLSKVTLLGYLSFLQFLQNFQQRNACEQAALISQTALDPAITHRARRGEFTRLLDHFDLL
jgi:hypothetical protein